MGVNHLLGKIMGFVCGNTQQENSLLDDGYTQRAQKSHSQPKNKARTLAAAGLSTQAKQLRDS
jgi:hypothetical protein